MAPPKRPTIGQQLAAWRDTYKVTQKELAHELGTDYGTISKWENDLHRPGPAMQEKIEVFFDWPLGTIRQALRHGMPIPDPPKQAPKPTPALAASAAAEGDESVSIPRDHLEDLIRSQREAVQHLEALRPQIADLKRRLAAVEAVQARRATRRRSDG